MPYKVTIKSGVTNVILGGRGPFNAGDVVLLTDEDFAGIRPETFTTLFAATPAAINTTTTSPYT